MNDVDRIDVDFVLTGQYIDLEIISSQTGMKPSIWRTKEDWPETVVNGGLLWMLKI